MLYCHPTSLPVRSASPAAFDPISLDEAKAQCGVSHLSEHDQVLSELIANARESVEHDAMVVTATGTYTVKRTEWGYGDYFELPSSLRPVTAVSSITYVNTSGSTATWSSSEYSLDTYTIQPIVKLAYGYTWPALRGDINGITITCTAGYSATTSIPKRIRDAVKLHVHHSWLLKMNEVKEADLQLKAYERVINLIRCEVYA